MTPDMMMGAQPPGGGVGFGALGVVFAILWLLTILGFIVGSIMTLIAIWRAASAHKSLARSAKELVEILRK